MMWNDWSFNTKLNVLAGETWISFDLLMENEELVKLIRDGADKDACLKFINENF